MKTIDSKIFNKKSSSNKNIVKLLIDDPKGNQLLNQSPIIKKAELITDLISLKKSKENKGKSVSVLISSISICLSLLFTIGMFEWKSLENGSTVILDQIEQSYDDLLEIPQTEQIKKPPVMVQAPAIIEVDDQEIIEEIEINLDIEMTEDTRIEEIIFNPDNETMPEEKVEEIFLIVEVQPSPVGGMKVFYEYVSRNLKYPDKAKRMGIEGRVFVEFVVEKDGSLTDVKAVKGIGGGCDIEAVRVLSHAPKWQAGKQRGRAVRVRMIMPIVFRLME